jgi:hypothetical protein
MLPTAPPQLAAEPAIPVVPPPTAVPFRDLGPGRCYAFLAGQAGAGGLCCGKRVERRRDGRALGKEYCAEHRPLFVAEARR